MCGIAGFSGRFDVELLRAMAQSIAHRGPDDAGELHLAEHGIGLAHRRLSIIDLSPAGHQPMWDVTRSAAIVYNGETYNYRELREELLRDGFQFNGESDTEVILNLYLRDGTAMLERLNGIFAFAIWDPRRSSLFVARDPLGVKPLYYAETRQGFLFSSELKALLHEPSVPREIDPSAIWQHLSHIWCPSPMTMLRGVRKLDPGHAMTVEAGHISRSWRYYEPPLHRGGNALTEAEAIEAVGGQLRRSVERQLVADVPVGAFLSGGLDSSAIVAMAQQALPEGRRLQCFTIGFQDEAARIEGMAQDLDYARQVASALDVDLHVITVGTNMADELETMIYHLDEPQADPAPINTLFIARLAREHGIKVLLSGTGGDEVFAGYRRHFALMQERRWSWLPRPLRAALRASTAAIPPSNDLQRRIVKAFQYADLDGDERIASYFNWIPPSRLQPLLSPELREQLEQSPSHPMLEALGRLPEDLDPLARMLYLESRFYLADHNLNYADKIPMAEGVEVRVPLLDPDLIELVASLPLRFKQRGRGGKWVLRRAMDRQLPRGVLSRPKAAFGAPLRHWLRAELRGLVDDVLSPASLAGRGLFDPQGVQHLIQMDRSGRVDAAYTIFSLICIELWCRIFLDRPPRSA